MTQHSPWGGHRRNAFDREFALGWTLHYRTPPPLNTSIRISNFSIKCRYISHSVNSSQPYPVLLASLSPNPVYPTPPNPENVVRKKKKNTADFIGTIYLLEIVIKLPSNLSLMLPEQNKNKKTNTNERGQIGKSCFRYIV